MASITWKAYEEILFQHSTYVAYMVVDYLTCKELTALQSCRKKKVGKILIRLLIDYTRSPDKLLELMRSPPGVHQDSWGSVSCREMLQET